VTIPSGQAATPLALTKRWRLGPVGDIAVSPEAVYALYTPATVEGALAYATDNRLARIDRMSSALITAGPFPYAEHVAVAGGLVWLGGNNQYPATPFPESSTLIGVDARTLAVVQRLSFPGTAHPLVANLAGDSDSLWLAYGTRVYRLSAGTGSTLVSQAINGIATSIALDPSGRHLYIGMNTFAASFPAAIIEVDPLTLTALVSASTGGGDLGGPHVAAGANDVWVSFATGMLGQVEHRQASNLALLPVAPVNHSNGVRVAVIAGMIWVADSIAGQLICLDPNTGAVRAGWSTQQGGVVAGDGSELYFGDITGVGRFQPDSRCL
jgi:hypothetical protein